MVVESGAVTGTLSMGPLMSRLRFLLVGLLVHWV